MKLNNPVDCQIFFAVEMEKNQEKLWCVSLRLNGQILSLTEADLDSLLGRKHLENHMNFSNAKQILFVRVNPQHLIFDDRDWEIIADMKTWTHKKNIDFCDYVKVNQIGYCSLLNFVPL